MSQIAEENLLELSRKHANSLIPSIESAYIGLQIQGKYLPKKTSSIITSDYLLKVLFEECYVPDIDEIKIGLLLRSVKKYQVIEELKNIELENQSWGINEKHQPDKQWAVNVLETLKPDSHLFKKYSPHKFDMKKFSQEQLKKIRSQDVTQGDSLKSKKTSYPKQLSKRTLIKKKFRKKNTKSFKGSFIDCRKNKPNLKVLKHEFYQNEYSSLNFLF